jgi:intein-encoded DNA endonuclease-like protein
LKRKSGIPSAIKKNKLFLKRFVRGVFDTDGTVFTSNKKGSPNYPTLEISNSNLALITDIYQSLKELKFRTHLRKTSKGGYKVSIYGKAMLRRWNEVIGSSNPYKRCRMESILEYFC